MLKDSLRLFTIMLGCLISRSALTQTRDVSSGELTVRLIEGMDSTTGPKAMSRGQVTKSTNPAIPKDSVVTVGLGPDPAGGYTAKLLQITIGQQVMPAASSAVVLAPNALGKISNYTRAPGQPRDSVNGRVFLPTQTVVRFTLTALPVSIPQPTPNDQASALPAAATWKVKPITTDNFSGEEATLAGVVVSGSKRESALLVIQCTVRHFTSTLNPSADVAYFLRMRASMITFPTDPLGCMGDGAGNDFGRFKVGDKPEFRGDFCYDMAAPESPAQPININLKPRDARSVIIAAGNPLQVSLRLPDKQADALTARFQLPADTSTLTAVTDPCITVMDQDAVREKATRVVACPEVSGKTLRKIDVLTGAAMKPLAPSSDNDIGIAWQMPKKTKAHPVPPKETLACFYGVGPDFSSDEKLEKRLLPIPSTAAYCVFREDGHCSTSKGTQ